MPLIPTAVDTMARSAACAISKWSYDPDPTDTTCITDYVYVLREADGSTKTIHDRHVEGLFPRADWLRLFEEVGFTHVSSSLQSLGA